MRIIIRFLLLAVVAFSLSACASQNGGNSSNQGVAPPRDFRQIQPPQEVSSNEDVLRNKISEDVAGMQFPALRSVNNFINASREAWADPTLSVLVMTVKKDGFPAFLERIMSSGKLKGLPRSKSALIKLRNEEVPGVENLFIAVPAEYMQEGDTILDWIPDMDDWVKSVDLQANKLTHLSPENAFLKLFWMANKLKNPELFANQKRDGKTWDWKKVPHPKDTVEKVMYLPIWTLR